MDDKIVVITGAAGLIGSGIATLLQGKRIVLVDNLDHPGKEKNLIDKTYLELVGVQQLFTWLKGRETEIDAIIHMGACSDTLEQSAQFLKENNTDYTRKLAEYALKNNIRFIYASSAATYGNGSEGFSDDESLLAHLKPLNLYGLSKHAFDLWAQSQGVLGQIVGLKYFNVFGPNEYHKGRMASMVYKMVPVILQEGVIRLYKSTDLKRFADGGQCRDFIYVKDAARMTCQFLNDRRGGIFNIGMGYPATWNELASAVFKALNKPQQIEYIEMPKELAAQYQNFTCAEMKKFGPLNLSFTLDEAVADYVNNYLMSNKSW
jgi:ADP-L-glycero-D-manno-heptose 6-epimerase